MVRPETLAAFQKGTEEAAGERGAEILLGAWREGARRSAARLRETVGIEGRALVEAELGETLDQVRTMTGALGVGVGRAALDDAVRYAKERVCFNQPIARFQAIRHKIAEAAADLEAARLLVYQAGRRIERGMASPFEAAAAKLFASEAANRIADQACRILGGYGFAMEYPVQRHLRDARFLLIGGGTSEILKDVIGRQTLG